ncbi:hypothetical protein DFQ28_008476 [Apophysomyces sp. BC1034]|nr:hypothetical protein DFQ30_008177 [Apophysomyces sp. BC1015]KAG0175274.1 hypothetical protein DFQ29_007216 [Apophysomyces sp. BC1021]KAG0185980.1 hypothetical protein DFQ28_008476 [Apophysomyces sp. BC1034]
MESFDERVNFSASPRDKNTIQYEAYICPLCTEDLTYIKSTVLRQRHVEHCLDSARPVSEPESQPLDDTYEYCIFCGKDISQYNGSRKESHFSRCMDEMAVETQQIEEQERQQKLASFAGQQIPFLTQLEICPSCHDTFPRAALRQKVVHIKQCSKRRNMTMQQLLNKFRWIQCGHQLTPRSSNTANKLTTHTSASTQGFIRATAVDEDNDFSPRVILHRSTPTLQNSSARNDKNDDDLQLVLALSKSMHSSKEGKRKERQDANAANIVTIEESRRLALQELDRLLYQPDDERRKPYDQHTLTIPLSRLQKNNTATTQEYRQRLSLWNLAAANETIEKRSFCSDFMKVL